MAQKTVRVPATVRPLESAELFAKIGGYIKTISVDIGDEVVAGQELAVLDVPEMKARLMEKASMVMLSEANVSQAEAKIKEAMAQLDALQAEVTQASTAYAQKQAMFELQQSECLRISNLVANGAIQGGLLDEANFKLKAAESDRESVSAQVATAEARLSSGNAAVVRAKADRDAAQQQIEVSKSQLKYAKDMMSYSTLRAPWDGKVASRMYDPGAFVQNAEGNSGAKPVLRLVRDDKVRVVFALSQKDLAGLKKGLRVSLGEIDALPKESFEGTISRYSAELDPATRMLRVEMDLENADGKLRSGYFGYATVHFE